MTWILNNLPSLLVGAALLAVLVLIVYKLIKNKKSGKSSCGCGCSACAMRDACHSQSTGKKP